MTDARVTVLTPDGRVTLLPKRAPVGSSGPIRGRTVTVVPTGPAAADPADALAALDPRHRSALPASDLTVFAATLGPDEAPAVAILDLAEDQAVTLGAALGLAEVFFWDGRRARLVTC